VQLHLARYLSISAMRQILRSCWFTSTITSRNWRTPGLNMDGSIEPSWPFLMPTVERARNPQLPASFCASILADSPLSTPAFTMTGRWLVMVSPCAGLRIPAEPGSAQSGLGRLTTGADVGTGVAVGAGRVLVGKATKVGAACAVTPAVGARVGGSGVFVLAGFVGGMDVSVGAIVAAATGTALAWAGVITPAVGLGAGCLVEVASGASVFCGAGDGIGVAYTTAGGVAGATGAASVAENRVAITQPAASPSKLRLTRTTAEVIFCDAETRSMLYATCDRPNMARTSAMAEIIKAMPETTRIASASKRPVSFMVTRLVFYMPRKILGDCQKEKNARHQLFA